MIRVLYLITVTGSGGLFPLVFVSIYLTYKFCLFAQSASMVCERVVKYEQGATNQQAGRFLREEPDFQT